MNTTPTKSVSAVKKYDRSKTPKQRNARTGWKRIQNNIDDLVAKTAANPELGSVISRWVLFGHLTRGEGMAARLYGEIVGEFERFFMDGVKRNPQSPSYQRGTAGADDIIAKKERNGTIADYERAARRARKRYKRLQEVLIRYPGASDVLNDICLHDREVEGRHRADAKLVLREIGIKFGLIGGRRS